MAHLQRVATGCIAETERRIRELNGIGSANQGKPQKLQSSRNMNYQYDIFISYKRYGEWTNLVRGEFFKVLHDHLGMELGRVPKIFIDEQLEEGTDWPKDLALKLATSRVLVPLFSKMYFGSTWCLKELYATRFKENELGLRTAQHPQGIIVAARIHDGEKKDLPTHLHGCCDIHAIDLKEFALTCLTRSSSKFEKFEEVIKLWVEKSITPAIARSANKQPDEAWLTIISEQSFECPLPADFDTDFSSLG